MKTRHPAQASDSLDPEARVLGAPESPLLQFAVVGALGAAVFLVGLALDSSFLRLVAKPWPVIALARWVKERRPSARGVPAALYLGALGDLLLELGPEAFTPGLVAFLAGHVCYARALGAEVTHRRPLRALLPFAVAAGLVAALAPSLGRAVTPIAVYAAVLAWVVYRAAERVGSPRVAPRLAWFGALGAGAFMVSDALIALDRFHAPIPHVRWPIIALYWAGQAGLAASFALGEDAVHEPVAAPGPTPTPGPTAAPGPTASPGPTAEPAPTEPTA